MMLLEGRPTTTTLEEDADGVAVRLFDGFEVTRAGRRLPLSENVQRLVAMLALARRPRCRSTVAAGLWMDVTDERAAANLRTTLWKARQLGAPLVDVTAGLLALSPLARTDVDQVTGQIARLLDDGCELAAADTDVTALNGELLPMWDDDWILFERERLRQLCIHGLEALARRLTALGRHAEAVDAGLSAVAADPLRESAQQVLIEAHLAERNTSEARRQYERYRVVLADALGIRPGAALERTVFGAP